MPNGQTMIMPSGNTIIKGILIFLISLSLFSCKKDFAKTPITNNTFQKNIVILYKYEGIKYHNNPKDPGGATKFGITLRTYKRTVNKNATVITIRNLTREQATAFYRRFFWNANQLGRINDKDLQTNLFLAEVNLGAHRPNKIAQNLSNALCDTKLKPDGNIGMNTVKVFNVCRMTPAYEYILFYFYAKTPSIQPVWKWAKKGLRNRVFLGRAHDKS